MSDTQAHKVALVSTISMIGRYGLQSAWHKPQHSRRFILLQPATSFSTRNKELEGNEGSITCMILLPGYFVGRYEAVFVEHSWSRVQYTLPYSHVHSHSLVKLAVICTVPPLSTVPAIWLRWVGACCYVSSALIPLFSLVSSSYKTREFNCQGEWLITYKPPLYPRIQKDTRVK